MLLLARQLEQLDFPALMRIYQEGNRENGAQNYPDEPAARQLYLAEADFYSYLRESFFRQKEAICAVWLEEGQYVSALRLEPYRDGLLIAALETEPQQRRRGFAGALLRGVQVACPGKILYSHVHKRNAASLAVHEKCGFRRVSEQAAYLDGSVNSRACTLRYDA